MSWVLPGRTAETRRGTPPGAMRPWTRPACRCAFPEYHLSICAPFRLVFLSEQRSEKMSVPSRITKGSPLASGPFQRFLQAGGLRGEDGDAFVLVAVGGGLRDAEAPAEAGDVRLVTEPGDDELRLHVAGQCACSLPGAEFIPVFSQEIRNLAHKLDGHVEGGTIGDHAGPLAGRTVVSLLVPKAPHPLPVCPCMSACLPLCSTSDQMTDSGCWENLTAFLARACSAPSAVNR